jgi:uncharacterized RDD family membrane protein YckC
VSAVDGIVTPEAVVLQFESAGLASRMLALTVDLALQFVLVMMVVLGTLALVAGTALGGIGAALLYISLFLIVFGYPAAMETLWRGRTLGKAALGLRVVTIEGAPITFRHAAIRSIFAAIDVYATSAVVGVIAMLLTRRNQRLGDLVAGTIVLRERTSAKSLAPVRFTVPPGLEAYTATLSTAALEHADYGAVRSFLLRASGLAPHIRAHLASQLAAPLAARLRTTPPPQVDPETFLVCIAAAFQRRMERSGGTAIPVAAFESVWSGVEPAAEP